MWTERFATTPVLSPLLTGGASISVRDGGSTMLSLLGRLSEDDAGKRSIRIKSTFGRSQRPVTAAFSASELRSTSIEPRE